MKNYNSLEAVFVLEDCDIVLPGRDGVTNKGDCGRLLVVGGGSGMAGAPSFAAEAAYRSGVGLVEVVTHEVNRIPLQITVPEAITSLWGEWDIKRLNTYSAAAVGVGMGRSDEARRLLGDILARVKIPTVLDADALNMISETPELLEYVGKNTVLTPHIMEFSRLTKKSIDEIKKAPIAVAREFSVKYGTNIILKDRISVIALADGETLVNTTGDSTLSKGGSGDILTGIAGSLLAQGMPMERAVPIAAYIHGKAGEAAGREHGIRSALARDILKSIHLGK